MQGYGLEIGREPASVIPKQGAVRALMEAAMKDTDSA